MRRAGKALRPRKPASRPEVRNPLAAWEPQARAFLLASKAVNTLRAYRADWNHFTAWCAAHEQASLPAIPETVAYYLTALAGSHKPATPSSGAGFAANPRQTGRYFYLLPAFLQSSEIAKIKCADGVKATGRDTRNRERVALAP